MLWSTPGQGTLGRGLDTLEIPLWITATACTASLAFSLAALLWCTLFSSPSKFHQVSEAAFEGAKAAHLRCEEMEAQWIGKKAEIAGVLESLEGVLDSVEKKRRQTAAGVSKLRLQEEPEPTSREDQLAVWRAKVYGTQG